MSTASALSPADQEHIARLYAGMSPEQVADHEDWVRRFKAEQAVKQAEEVRAAAKRRLELLAMSDKEVVSAAIDASNIWGEVDEAKLLSILREAGFTRASPIVPASALFVVEIVYRDGRDNTLLTPAGSVPRAEADSIYRTYRDSVTPEQGCVGVFSAGEA